MSSEERIVIRSVAKPQKESAEALMDWFFDVFDLNKGNDAEPAIFREIVNNSINGKGTTSIMLTKKLKIPRSTAIYHLNRFISSGLVARKGTRYYLRAGDMTSTIAYLQADMLREFGRMMQFAEKMDDIFWGEVSVRRKERK